MADPCTPGAKGFQPEASIFTFPSVHITHFYLEVRYLMSSYTLDDIRAAAENKYASTDITIGETKVVLVNAIRLPKEKRAALLAIQDKLEEEGSDQETVLSDAIRTIAETDAQADVLLDACGEDLAMLATIFETYGKATQVGEA